MNVILPPDLEKYVAELKDAGDWYELTVVRQVAARPDVVR